MPFQNVGYAIVAHLYNTSASLHGGRNNAVYTFKHHGVTDLAPGVTKIGVMDIERGLSAESLPDPWQDDTSLGDWFYNVRDAYKTASEVADTLVDVVSKNGNLLMNVTQKPDGTIDDETRYSLERVGAWLKTNGAGIYRTRPYKKYREGKTELAGGAFKEERAAWRSTDFRFTTGDGAVYAFMMRATNAERAVVQALGRNSERAIASVEVSGQTVQFQQKDGALIVTLPPGLDETMPVCIKATFAR